MSRSIVFLFVVQGHPLFRLSKNQALHAGHESVRRLLSEHGYGCGGALATHERHHRDQTAQPHVHVSGEPRSEADLSRRKVNHGRKSFTMLYAIERALKYCKLKKNIFS